MRVAEEDPGVKLAFRLANPGFCILLRQGSAERRLCSPSCAPVSPYLFSEFFGHRLIDLLKKRIEGLSERDPKIGPKDGKRSSPDVVLRPLFGEAAVNGGHVLSMRKEIVSFLEI